ncbi:MAG: ribonuclease HII [Bifidobacteriaceae bacterium]|nr:ribonuclease HII [Bifidobacteriaceae bacterium]MCI1979128.1 ribonuclease HII [Bifidobacteriaceae bacterium]
MAPTLEVEASLFDAGADVVIGFDEVGRGALAGPVMVGAAAIRRHHLEKFPEGLADSKMLTEKRREAMFDPLQQWVDAWAVGAASNKEIDAWGISHALGVAALRALSTVETALAPIHSGSLYGILDGPNDYISKNVASFDAPPLAAVPVMTTQVKADQTCASVSAASVLAKVTRDRIMEKLGQKPEYAAYGWVRNKGYGSQQHRMAIEAQGPCELHRLSWHLVRNNRAVMSSRGFIPCVRSQRWYC